MEKIRPDWPAPANVCAVSTTRDGGVSQPPFESLNLGLRCDDDPAAVVQNRELLRTQAGLPSAPVWLQQVHGVRVVDAAGLVGEAQADASFTTQHGVVCTVLTADCLPILLCDVAGSCVAAAHAGWRGLAAGVIEQTVAAMPAAASELMAWLGPAIGPHNYEVGTEVRDAFLAQDHSSSPCFQATTEGHYLADLYGLARQRLAAVGVAQVSGGEHCTFRDQRLFSYRRAKVSGYRTGRQATLIWLSR